MNAIGRDAYTAEQIGKIHAWKGEEPGVVASVTDFLLSPFVWLIRQIVPDEAVEAILHGADWLSELTVPGGSGLPADAGLRARDVEAASVQNWAISYAVGEGAAAGALGIMAAPLDIPAVIAHSLRTIRRVGLCYGYAGTGEDERRFVLGVLASAGANTMNQKMRALLFLASLQRTLATRTFRSMAGRAAAGAVSKEAAVIALRDLAKQIGLNLTKRKMLAAIPAVGALVGGSLNGWYIDDVGTAAQRAYQERWLRDSGILLGGDEAPPGLGPNR